MTGHSEILPAQPLEITSDLPAEATDAPQARRAEAPQFPPLAYLYGEPQATANLRTQADDFIVDEELSFTPTGHGEHLLLLVEKIGQNTQYVAKQIAAAAGLKARLVSYAGLKDRHAVTRQWFCLPVPIKQELHYQDWNIEGVRILQTVRHQRRLKLGSIKQNHFQLKLRNVSDQAELEAKLQQIQQGVPNYYGEQRFGHFGGNLQLAARLFAGESIPDRQLRGLALSASRSMLFNQQVSARVREQLFLTLLPGAVVQLDGSGSVFSVPELTDEISQRLQEQDLHPTAILPGIGKVLETGAALDWQLQQLAPYQHWVQALCDLNVNTERRSCRLVPKALSYQWQDDTLALQFALPTGCFATSVLRELVKYQDLGREQVMLEC
ncbi:tRNA pseudouridine(13) synthase TruD [Rheinheimera riviphila]|uniref:tRNA pseudouridine synthase D n=1 Tax=Rheinheimera riviphila TaxID=1834037 RepID=A0A437R4H9_9GAMM|nr:tRNA pseudouridine(13) synthase TruD [Rheinheimera riviphila]RVU41642.1 tRNA pseudouridine(13) synthase TruD [Rheinheimera riviphila]